MSGQNHPLFQEYPLRGEVDLSTGSAPTPYHVYAGHGTVILGFCAADALEGHFADQDVFPVLTQEGRGILILFACDFVQASHGSHKEFHITALAAPKPGCTLPNDPGAALSALATQPTWGVLSLHLYNDTAQVVAYNDEHLGLSAERCEARMSVTKTEVSFAFVHTDGPSLATGRLRVPPRSDTGLMFRVLRHLGWSGIVHAMRRAPAITHVINRKCSVLPRNGRARTTTMPDKMIVTAFDPKQDRFEGAEGPLAALSFEPKIVQHLWPFRFVYLHPDES